MIGTSAYGHDALRRTLCGVVSLFLTHSLAYAEIYKCGETFSSKPCEAEGTVVEQTHPPKKSKILTAPHKAPVSDGKKHAPVLSAPSAVKQSSHAAIRTAPEAATCREVTGAPRVEITKTYISRKDIADDALLTFHVTVTNKSTKAARSPISLHLLSPDGKDRRIPIAPALGPKKSTTKEVAVSVHRTEQAHLLTTDYMLSLHYSPAGSCRETLVNPQQATVTPNTAHTTAPVLTTPKKPQGTVSEQEMPVDAPSEQ